MKQLLELETKLKALKGLHAGQVASLELEALDALDVELKTPGKAAALKKMISDLENSSELTQVENDDTYHSWTRVDFGTLIDIKNKFQCETLRQYISENYSYDCNFKDDCISQSIGYCIIVNHEGDVLDQDSGKWFIKRQDYETREERNSQIEAYMNKTGYFPSVLLCDYYGGARYINTQSQNETKAV